LSELRQLSAQDRVSSEGCFRRPRLCWGAFAVQIGDYVIRSKSLLHDDI
jgi:hypothetical protein